MEQAKVLVVEDDLLLSMVEERMIQNLGFNVIGTASDGEEAITKCKELQPDIILMDISLKGELDGIDTMKAIRKTSDVPVIYLSGSSERYYYERANKIGFSGYLVKPVTSGDLEKPILHALKNKKMLQKESFLSPSCNNYSRTFRIGNYSDGIHA